MFVISSFHSPLGVSPQKCTDIKGQSSNEDANESLGRGSNNVDLVPAGLKIVQKLYYFSLKTGGNVNNMKYICKFISNLRRQCDHDVSTRIIPQ